MFDIPSAHDGCVSAHKDSLNEDVGKGRDHSQRYRSVMSAHCGSLRGKRFSIKSVAWEDVRPKKSARDVRVPNSASKRSMSGVRARMLNSAWKKLRWIKGNVFNRYTARCD